MSQPDVPETPDGSEEPPSFSFADLNADDAPPITEPRKPDHKASRTRSWGRRASTSESSGTKDRTTYTPRAKTRKPPPPRRKGMFIEPLENIYASMAIVLMPFDPICANAIAAAAPACAKSLDDLAYQNDAVRRMIFALVNTSAIGAVITAHLPILLAVAIHHVPGAANAGGVLKMKFTPEPDAEPEESADHAAA